MYIANNPQMAILAERYSVERLFVDLEVRGKMERQAHVNSVKSNHSFNDVVSIKNVLTTSDLLVRVNPLYEGTKHEVDSVIERGADIVMLPMFKTADDAKRFVDIVGGRAKTMLLLETISAEKDLDNILQVPGVDEIHIGINDLHLDYKLNFMFETLSNGTVERICNKIKTTSIPYGFGGIASLNKGMLPGRNVIAEHYRLGSTMAILSRSFYDSTQCDDIEKVEKIFADGLREIREYETEMKTRSKEFFLENQQMVKDKVAEIVALKKAKDEH